MTCKLLQNELRKAARTRLPYFGFFVVGLLCWIIYVAAEQLSSAATANAWGFVSLAMQLVFSDIGLIFILVFSTLLMAEETSTGTLQAILASPVYRWEVYLAKTLTALLYMMVLSFTALLFSAGLAALRHKFGAVGDAMGQVYGLKEVLGNFALAWLASWVPLAALVMYGLLLSTLISRPGAAVAVALGGLYLIEFTKHLVGIDPYIFTRYISFPWQVFHQVAGGVDYQWQPELGRMLVLCGLNGLGAFAAGLWFFQRKDLNA